MDNLDIQNFLSISYVWVKDHVLVMNNLIQFAVVVTTLLVAWLITPGLPLSRSPSLPARYAVALPVLISS